MNLLIQNFPTTVRIDVISIAEKITVVNITRLHYKVHGTVTFHFFLGHPYISIDSEKIDCYKETYLHSEIAEEIYLTQNFDFLQQTRFIGFKRQIKKDINKIFKEAQEKAIQQSVEEL